MYSVSFIKDDGDRIAVIKNKNGDVVYTPMFNDPQMARIVCDKINDKDLSDLTDVQIRILCSILFSGARGMYRATIHEKLIQTGLIELVKYPDGDFVQTV